MLRNKIGRLRSAKVGCSNTFNPFLPIVLDTGCYSCVLLRGTKFEGNRSSPLYVICLNWIHEIQFVDFDSKLFYGRHCQIEPDGEHPTSIERNSFNHLSMCPPNFALCASMLYKFIVPMPSTINSTNFSSLVSTALFPESNRSGALSLPAESIERDIKPQRLDSNQ